MKKAAYILLLITGLSFLLYCSEKQEDKRAPLARVFDKYLYVEDIQDIFINDTIPEDSLETLNSYVDLWVKKQLLRKKAELNLSDEQKNITEQIEEYRSSLLIHKYQQRYLQQKLDTKIDDEDIEEYYRNNTANFILSENIIKAIILKIRRAQPNMDEIRAVYRIKDEEDVMALKMLCDDNQIISSGDNWMYFKDFHHVIPQGTTIFQPEYFLKTTKYFEPKDSTNQFFINILEYKTPGDTVPLSLVKNRIKTIILNHRKNELVNDLENHLYKDAKIHNNIELFIEEEQEEGKTEKKEEEEK